MERTRCVFVEKLARALNERCDLRISVPVPWVPPLKAPAAYEKYRGIPRRDELDGLPVVHPRYLVTPGVARSLHGFFMFLSLLAHHWRCIARQRPDVIFGVWAYPDGLANLLTGKLFSIPVVIACRGSDINYLTRHRLHRRLIRWTLNNADRVLSVSEALKREIVALGVPDEKVVVTPNGVEREKFKMISKRSAQRSLALTTGPRYIVSVSRLSREKGLDILVRAFARLSNRNAHLLLVGEGRERQNLENLCAQLGVADRVTLVGDRPNDEIPLWLNAADLFVLPSRTEGWPNVLMEAMACGKPAVGTRVGGIPEIISSPRLGIVAPAENPDALAEAIDDALLRFWDAAEIRQHIIQRDWGTVADETCLVLTESAVSPRNTLVAERDKQVNPDHGG